MSTGKIQIQIERAYDGCRWVWDVWVNDKYSKNGVEDTVEDAMYAVIKWFEGV